MRLVIAVIRPAQLESVRQALSSVHVTRLSVCDAQEHPLGITTPDAIARRVILEIAVNDDFVARTIHTIRNVLAAGASADDEPSSTGSILVLPMEQAVQLYREVRGPEAI